MNIPPKVRDDELREFFNTYVITVDASKGKTIKSTQKNSSQC